METQYKERSNQVFLRYLPPGSKHVNVSDLEALYFCEWSGKALEFGLSHGLVDPGDAPAPKVLLNNIEIIPKLYYVY